MKGSDGRGGLQRFPVLRGNHGDGRKVLLLDDHVLPESPSVIRIGEPRKDADGGPDRDREKKPYADRCPKHQDRAARAFGLQKDSAHENDRRDEHGGSQRDLQDLEEQRTHSVLLPAVVDDRTDARNVLL